MGFEADFFSGGLLAFGTGTFGAVVSKSITAALALERLTPEAFGTVDPDDAEILEAGSPHPVARRNLFTNLAARPDDVGSVPLRAGGTVSSDWYPCGTGDTG